MTTKRGLFKPATPEQIRNREQEPPARLFFYHEEREPGFCVITRQQDIIAFFESNGMAVTSMEEDYRRHMVTIDICCRTEEGTNLRIDEVFDRFRLMLPLGVRVEVNIHIQSHLDYTLRYTYTLSW